MTTTLTSDGVTGEETASAAAPTSPHRGPVTALVLAVVVAAAAVTGLGYVLQGLFAVLAVFAVIIGIGLVAVLVGLPWLLAVLAVIALVALVAALPWWLFGALAMAALIAVVARVAAGPPETDSAASDTDRARWSS